MIDFRRSLYRVDPLQPILGIVAILAAVTFALNVDGSASFLAWTGIALIVAVIALSIAVPERINSQFRRREEGEVPPNADVLRVRWRTFHYIRLAPAIAGFMSLILAATLI